MKLLTTIFLILIFHVTAGAEWPQFRGPDGQGHAPQRGLATSWSETENLAWKVPVAGRGWSSPVIGNGQIWLTTALDQGHSLHAVCLDEASGKLLHDVEVFRVENPGTVHSKNSFASPTAVLEGDRVYVHFGDLGTACLTTRGDVVWRTNELKYKHGHGPAGSPVLYGDLLIVSCDGTDVQYVAALDKQSGKLRWKSDRQGRMAYSTPLVITVDGKDQLISTGGDQAIAYVPDTGKEIWRVRYDGYSEVPRPVFGQGLLFLASGYDTPWLYAVRPDGQGDVTDTHVVWKLQHGAPLNPSPLVVGDALFLVSDKGIASCLDAKSGEKHWQKRLPGNYSASPLLADGRVYITNESGLTTVIAPTSDYTELAANPIDGETLASLAVSGKAIFLRSDTHLYRIEAK
ncbi:MAG: pyrrolo-quinoline quinone [Planctomycetia bacterium 21-64-5]|nr:MAG: pyrrolo-quinoline quinone [Planctomycetia bacterium 21-64-5]HQU42574.1 PQQ-binding-like beta-propeller repeat protein [Pirellulales bacterium]